MDWCNYSWNYSWVNVWLGILMNGNEPVAWMITNRVISSVPMEGAIPLYTHPVKEQLTDEEIIKVYEDMLGVASAKDSAIDFARSILKKAQGE